MAQVTGQGLIVGKFYPPHRGHKFLIDYASERVEELAVIVCEKQHENPPGAERARWLAELHPDARIILIDDDSDEQDPRVWAENAVRFLGHRPDVVFSSEDYGHDFAMHLGCLHDLVDKQRTVMPVSGTAVRSNPYEHWQYLEAPVRGWYAFRVVLVGSESTGKTTLAQQLAKALDTVWVPEYGRDYTEQLPDNGNGHVWTTEEFVHIAKVQCQLEDEAARNANRVLVCDTDAFATAIWHHRYMGHRDAAVDAVAAAHRKPDLYLLTDVATPFEADAIRDGESFREWMHGEFLRELAASGVPFHAVGGNPDERLDQALQHVAAAMRAAAV